MKKSNQLRVALDELEHIDPITENQKKAFEAWDEGHNLVLNGSAGTGKTFIALYLAFSKMLKYEQYNKLLIIRSMVSTRDGGHLPGTKEEKEEMAKQEELSKPAAEGIKHSPEATETKLGAKYAVNSNQNTTYNRVLQAITNNT